MTRRTIGLLGLFGLLAAPTSGQRHLPELQVFDAPTPVVVDTRSESPAVYHGVRTAALPAQGGLVEFQVFAPRASGRAGFACSLEFLEGADRFHRRFEVRSVTDWTGTELSVVPGSEGLVRVASRMRFADVPPGGHILTVQLASAGGPPDRNPLAMRCSVSIASIPPRRLMRAVGEVRILWQ